MTAKPKDWLPVPETMPPPLPFPAVWLGRFVRYVIRALRIPPSRWRDFAMCYALFIIVLRRFPKRRLLHNDVLFWVKVSPFLDEALPHLVSDKELVKQHIAKVVGDSYNIPTHAVLRHPDEVDAFPFPARCVIKSTHGWAQVILRRNGEKLDLERIKSWFEFDYYRESYEINYQGLVPKVIVECFALGAENPHEIKIHCIAGKARMVAMIADRSTARSCTNFDTQWNELVFIDQLDNVYRKFKRPGNLAEILEVAEKLAADFYAVRIDGYTDGKAFQIGEITNCSGGALNRFFPPEGEIIASKVIFEGRTPEQWSKFLHGLETGAPPPPVPQNPKTQKLQTQVTLS
ncbi:ATP-grasp fold amidoligase family protein [Aestuariivirga litoralis]|uniref:ATP-grasp fold amidoligase family protein n=1 Tax=Aestuariivirga litoralis TaxID=2650924 RepID=UPI0018C45731|nr:ATP-grasp fold amidoligase family protein [Aestuariivirga litoralis]MBG1231238.1 hypothetical protein [Aestuariivirga litoralis]